MKALIEVQVKVQDKKDLRQFILVENVQDDDQLWQIVDKLKEDYCCVRLIWTGLSAREYTAHEVLTEKRILG